MKAPRLPAGALLVLAGCYDTNCDEIRPIRVEGEYDFEYTNSYDNGATSPVVDGTLFANDREVVVEYMRKDGTRWRATYRIATRNFEQ
jgi:hypothetical protein